MALRYLRQPAKTMWNDVEMEGVEAVMFGAYFAPMVSQHADRVQEAKITPYNGLKSSILT